MISLDRASYQVQPRYAEYVGLSTDVKPVEVDNGDEFQEIDTGFVYKFDETNTEWVKQPTGGGSGGTGDYNDLINLPQINGVTLEGNKTTEELGIDIPTELPNPFSLTFTGAVTAEYNGSEAVSVEIPEPSGILQEIANIVVSKPTTIVNIDMKEKLPVIDFHRMIVLINTPINQEATSGLILRVVYTDLNRAVGIVTTSTLTDQTYKNTSSVVIDFYETEDFFALYCIKVNTQYGVNVYSDDAGGVVSIIDKPVLNSFWNTLTIAVNNTNVYPSFPSGTTIKVMVI